MKVGVIGSGAVGEKLANGFLKNGYQVMRGSRTPEKLEDWKKKSSLGASTGDFDQTAQFGELVVLAVKGVGAESALQMIKPEHLKGKTVIDTTNPISDEPPVNGVLSFFTNMNFSLMERLQKQMPEAHFVKAFSCVGNQFMVDPQFKEGKPSMFICGDSKGAKGQVREILLKFGWEVEDMGCVEAARAIEPLCMLWCIPGFLNGTWSHAFKFLKN
jgi:hypothetical protein